ncbi:MAG: serine phosphatase RsbU, regulator of sigma subunit [Frankiales bacterium]|nr:serine phosphatase RsbU, regulator of sigma subunit [Frankiales bacterium]
MIGTERATCTLDGDARTPSAARAMVRTALANWQLECLTDTLVLLTSELATNVVLHAGTGYDVTLERRHDVVRLTVLDDSPIGPSRRRTTLRAATGRGLALLDTLARDWGRSDPSQLNGRAKGIWCEVAVEAPAQFEEGAMYGTDWLATLDAPMEL